MKRFFPLLLLLTLICFSFTLENETSCENVDAIIVESHIEMCEFVPNPDANGYGTTQCPGMPAELTIAPDCTGSAMAHLLVTNLSSNPIIGYTYSLPIGQPPIFYEYINNGTSITIGPITSLIYKGRMHKVGNTPFPVFEHELPMSFDCSYNCGLGITYQYFDAKLTKANGDLYDIAAYAGANDIFYTGVFEPHAPEWYLQACAESCGGCANKKVSQETTEINSHQKFTLSNSSIDEESNNEESTSIVPELGREFDFEISPNPFTNDINIQFASNIDNEVSVQIIDVSGKTIINKNNVNIIDQSLRISGESFKTGIYYCRIISNNEVSTKKLVKN